MAGRRVSFQLYQNPRAGTMTVVPPKRDAVGQSKVVTVLGVWVGEPRAGKVFYLIVGGLGKGSDGKRPRWVDGDKIDLYVGPGG